jgi:glycosyltransferase involved in cell wall biosynthesis
MDGDPLAHGREPVASIVIPAHNEAAVIAANLSRLLATARPGEFDVVVIANACSDDTAAIARTFDVRVIETPLPGKAHAIAIGDDSCHTFPRLYVDADVALSTESARALVAACERPGVLACAPAPRMDLTGVGRFVARVHRVHDRLIAPGRALAGVGVYVLTEAGHARVFPMPSDVISDDGWVHASFTSQERIVVTEAESLVRPARTVGAHLRRRVRVRRGNRQLAGWNRGAAEGRLGLGVLASHVRQGSVGPIDAGCYLSVLAADRALSRIGRGRDGVWGSDVSSRVGD